MSDYESGGDNADSVREMYRDEQDEAPLVYRVELTGAQMTRLKLAARDAARWYAKYGGDVLAQQVTEYRDLETYLDAQVPESSAPSSFKSE